MTKKSLLLFSLVGLIVGGCESMGLKTREELRNPESSSPAPAAKKAGGAKQIEGPKSVAAAPSDNSEESESQMRQLNGRVDEVENGIKQTNVSMQAVRDGQAKDKQAADQKIAALEEEVRKLAQQVEALTEQVNKPKPAAPADPAAIITDGDDLMEAKKYKEAIVAYQKYRDGFPKGGRYAEATYKIGVCFEELKMKDDAKVFFKEVVSNYGKSPEAKKATKHLKTLK